MATLLQQRDVRLITMGIRVARAAANLPQTASTPYFTVSGGRIILTSIVGQVTTIIQAQINAVKLISTPTVGTAVDMCATVDINGKEVGTLLTITGLPSDAMYAPNAGLGQSLYRKLVIPVGTINFSAGASSTGATSWVLTYIPLDDGASVVAA